MRIDRSFRIEAIASPPSDNRPVLTQVNVQRWERAGKAQDVAITANGYVAVIVPITLDEGDELGTFPAEALKTARKSTPKAMGEACIALGKDRLTFIDGSTAPRPDVGTFPDMSRIVPTLDAHEKDPGQTFALDATYLKALGEAFGESKLAFRRVSATGPVLLKPLSVPHATDADWQRAPLGVLMPCYSR